jgi:hypothetical protein
MVAGEGSFRENSRVVISDEGLGKILTVLF